MNLFIDSHDSIAEMYDNGPAKLNPANFDPKQLKELYKMNNKSETKDNELWLKKYDEYISLAQKKGKTDGEIMSILKQADYVLYVCRVCIVLLKSEKAILSVMKKTGYDVGICIRGVRALKSDQAILSVMKATNYESVVCQEAFLKLKLEQREEKEIISIIKQTNYDWYVCCVCVILLKSEKAILSVMKKSGYNYHVCAQAVWRLNQIMS